MDVRVWRKEGWGLKNWCFQTGVLENTLDCPLDYKEIQPVNPKGNQSWIFTGRTDAEAEAPIFWTPHENWHLKKGPDAGKDWRQEEKGMTEGEMVRRHQWLNGHEFEQTPGVGDGQGGLACRSPWGHKESDMTEWLNWTFTFIKTLFSSSSLSAIRVVSSACLRLLIFLPAILIPACASFSQHFTWCILHIG